MPCALSYDPSLRLANILSSSVSFAATVLHAADPQHHFHLVCQYTLKFKNGEFDQAVSSAILVCNWAVRTHTAALDTDDSYSLMVPSGTYLGGQLHLPDLSVIIAYEAGDVAMGPCFAPSMYLTKSCRSWVPAPPSCCQ
ncbi:hypothetical protein JCM5296_000039 [Sporobolomyces johnsonii]